MSEVLVESLPLVSLAEDVLACSWESSLSHIA